MARSFLRKFSFNKVLGAYRSQWKRALKRLFFPGYGKKGMGWLRNPRKASYNWWYHRTSVSLPQLFGLKASRGSSLLFGLFAALFSSGPSRSSGSSRSSARSSSVSSRASSGTSSQSSSGSSSRSSAGSSSRSSAGSSSRSSADSSSMSSSASTTSVSKSTSTAKKTTSSRSTQGSGTTRASSKSSAAVPPHKKSTANPAPKSSPVVSAPAPPVQTTVTPASAAPAARRNKMIPLADSLPNGAESLAPGMALTFEVAPDQTHGSNAVALCYQGQKIGYAAKQDFFVLAAHLRLRRTVRGSVISVSSENGQPVIEYEAQLY